MSTANRTDGRDTSTTQGITRGESATGDADRTPVDVVRAPPRASQAIAMVAVLVGALSTAPFAMLAIPFGAAGVVLVGAAMFWTHSRGWLSAGTALVLFGALVTGAYGAVSTELMLVGVGSTILAWDVGQHGIVIGRQLGRRARTTRNLLVHATTTAVVTGLVSAIAYLGFLVAAGGRHAAAVVIVLVGAIILAWVYRV